MSSVMAPPEDLRVEYEKQMDNIRRLRTLYEERAEATSIEHRRELDREEARITVLETKLRELQEETDEVKEVKKELEDKIEKLQNSIQLKENELETTKDDLFSSTVQNKSLNSQVALINNLFSHMLVSPKVDLDRLTYLLQENHGLIKDLTVRGDSNEVAALLVDLAGQVENEQSSDQNQKENEGKYVIECDISSNLTKVWKVLIELLSYHDNETQTEPAGGSESCYKYVQTPSGPRTVISVSQTFLTLKDLILEKNKLVKEVGRLKTLNNHLENRLGNQEKRLSVVTLELRKTWGVVNKLKAQHKQLHTHEKILRYELHQKRCMLTELKQELELCRDKWELAREKNSQTEEDWKKLRKEFALRKTRNESNSAESGYEEDDVARSPSSELNNQEELFKMNPTVISEPEISEDDIEHSDGNSFDTVIDLLDIAYLEHQSGSQSTVPFVLCEVPPEVSEVSPSLLPLTSSEFTDGLDQIESEDLASVLDVQYQNQLLGADYNLSLPSSSGSSPVPTENDDFASSEMDVSEEDSSSNSNNLFSSPSLPTTNQIPANDSLLFGSNSSQNISKFLDGLFVESEQTGNYTTNAQNLTLNVHCTSVSVSENDSATPIVSEDNSCLFSPGSSTPMLINGNAFEFPSSQRELIPGEIVKKGTEYVEHTQKWDIDSQATTEQSIEEKLVELPSEKRTQEEILRAREDRLKRLEYQCRSLVNKVTSTTFRSEIISNKLDELHLSYGPSDDVSDISKEYSSNMLTNGSQESEHNKFEQTSASSTTSDRHKSDINSSIVYPKNTPNEEQAACSSGSGLSSQISSPIQARTPEQILEARAARLKRLEDQCKSLFCKMSATSSRSELISNKLDELHESYGAPEQAVTDTKVSKKNFLLKKSSSLESQNYKNEAECSTSYTNLKEMDITIDSEKVSHDFSVAGPSSVQPVPTADPRKGRTHEQILDARAERFKRLEDQCKSLVTQMTATSLRSELISNKLDKLHSSYGSSEDASDSEESPFSSREGRKRSTPTSSPKYSRKLAQLVERKNETDTAIGSSIDELKCRLPHGNVTLLQETNLPPEQTNEENTNVPISSQVAVQEKSKIMNSLESCSNNVTASSETGNLIAGISDEQISIQGCQPLDTELTIPSKSFVSAGTTDNNSSDDKTKTVNSITSHTETILLNSESKSCSDGNNVGTAK